MYDDDIEEEKLQIQNGEAELECTVQDVDYCIDDAGYGIVIVPKNKAFVCFASEDAKGLHDASVLLLSKLNELGIKHDCYVKG